MEWVKSSFSNGSGGNNCVEVGHAKEVDAFFVRHSKDIFRPYSIRFTRAEWDAFVAGVKAGEFDGI